MPELDRLLSSLSELQVELNRADSRSADRLEVGPAEDLHVLRLLAGRGGLRVSDIARAQAISNATSSARCDRLERRGLVRRERSLEDRRVVLVELTELGQRAARTSTAERREILADLDDVAGVAESIAALAARYRTHNHAG